jgi:hypothetical protein
MEPVLAQALATLAGAVATAILMAASYYWGPSQRGKRRDAEKDDED